MARTDGLRVGVVGATGMVGRELLTMLERRRFPAGKLFVYSSGKSAKTAPFRGKSLRAPAINERQLAQCDLVFFVSSDEVSERLAPRLASRGVWVVDDSTAFRLNPKIPLIIPEVNGSLLTPRSRLIAGPNCTMTGLAVAGIALHRAVGIRAVRLASYQSVSGAGKAALQELFSQSRALTRRLPSNIETRAPVLKAPAHGVLPGPIAFNVIPQVGSIGLEGHSSEETKVAAELRKVWGTPRLPVSVTAVRVPTIRGHALSAWLTLGRPLAPAAARKIMRSTKGLVVCGGDYPTPLKAAGQEPVFAGRIRPGALPNELCLWIVSDNLLKGAALNSIQIAELLLRKGYLRPAS